MVITILHLQNWALLIAGIINLIMSIIVFSRGVKHNKINRYFSLLTFFNFLWAISLLLSKSVFFGLFAEISYRTAYLAAIGIAISLFYFTIHFPYKNKNLNLYHRIITLFLAVILAILVYFKIHIIDFSGGLNLVDWFVSYYKPFYIAYSLFFFYAVASAMYFLTSKLKSTEEFFKNRIKILLATIFIGLIFGAYFNLWLPYFNNWDYFWIGPIFTIFMNAYVFYLIFHTKKEL